MMIVFNKDLYFNFNKQVTLSLLKKMKEYIKEELTCFLKKI